MYCIATNFKRAELTSTLHEKPPSLAPQNNPQTPPISPL